MNWFRPRGEMLQTIYDVTDKTVRKMELGHLTAVSYSQT